MLDDNRPIIPYFGRMVKLSLRDNGDSVHLVADDGKMRMIIAVIHHTNLISVIETFFSPEGEMMDIRKVAK